jgi:hypothetical protein
MEAGSNPTDLALPGLGESWQAAAFVGTRAEAIGELTARCRTRAQRLVASDHGGATLDPALWATAQRLAVTGEIELYLADDALPLIAAVRVTRHERRVICWGLGTLRPAEANDEEHTDELTDTSASHEWTLTIVAAQDNARPGDSAP